jgi:hypothetical protein
VNGYGILRTDGCVRLLIPQATEWECVGNKIKPATIFTRSGFVKVHSRILNSREFGSETLLKRSRAPCPNEQRCPALVPPRTTRD